MPNTRRALETAEWVRQHHPTSFDAVHAGLFAAHFAEGRALDDPEVLDDIVASAGAPADEVRRAVERGEASPLVERAMSLARDRGVTSTPTWVLPDGFAVPGALERSTLERWVRKLVAKHRAD
jgi:predicted DsbA family dithiol-disulfide isomerase